MELIVSLVFVVMFGILGWLIDLLTEIKHPAFYYAYGFIVATVAGIIQWGVFDMKTCKEITKTDPPEFCGGEMVTIDSGSDAVKTSFCEKCGLIKNKFNSKYKKQLREKAVRYEDDNTK